MADVADLAGVESDTQMGIWWKNREAEMEAQAQMIGTEFCVDCDERIPDKRRDAQPGCCRCVKCQSALEK